jgi:hypothetical protein
MKTHVLAIEQCSINHYDHFRHLLERNRKIDRSVFSWWCTETNRVTDGQSSYCYLVLPTFFMRLYLNNVLC